VANAITLTLDIDAQCVACGRERELDGSLIAQGDSVGFVEAPEACEACGERRVKVSWDVREAQAKAEG
jgi:hypothetical protein